MVLDLFLNINKCIGKKLPIFIIAEVGQNHQGNIDTAKLLIQSAKECGADCVKFQKTCIPEKFNKLALQRPYVNVNSWGETYGEHKRFLEFTDEQFRELQKYASDVGILFTASAMDLVSLNLLKNMDVPFIKIGSGDGNNFQLIKAAAQMQVPLIVSTGMQDFQVVNTVYEIISQYHKNFCLMHCISAYPTPLEDLNLNVIRMYQEKFQDINIGYSGHEIGIDLSVGAVAVGAKIIERHITLNHNQKGSDHICSLEPCEFKLMVQKIRTMEVALGAPVKELRACEIPCYEKLRKTIVLVQSFSKGHVLNECDLKVKVAEPAGIDGSLLNEVIGKVLKKDMEEDQSLTVDCLE